MSSIRRRKRTKRDVWMVDFRDASGRRVRLTAESKEKAELLLADKIKESHSPQQRLAGDPDATLGVYAAAWFSQLTSSNLKPRTIQSYQQLYDNHIAPTLGAIKIRELRRIHVKALLNAKREQVVVSPQRKEKGESEAGSAAIAPPAVEPKPERKLSRNTVRLIRACLSAMLAEAVDDELIDSNPAALPSRRRGQKNSASLSKTERQQAIRPFSDSEVSKILEKAARREKEHYPMFLLLARTGMRPGEAAALQWSDCNFTDRNIVVERAFSAGKLGTTKTDNVRHVDMSQELAATLTALYKTREADALRLGWGEVPDWIFVNSSGKPLDESRTRKRFARAMKRAEVSGHRLYDLRHTFATSLLAKGAPITYVAAQLGHARPSTTLQWYARWLPQSGVAFVDRLDGKVAGWHQFGTDSKSGTDGKEIADEKLANALENFGGPFRARTGDPLIKSQLLYQLS